MEKLSKEIRENLEKLASEKVRLGQFRYFREKVKFLGVTMPQTEAVARKFITSVRLLDRKKLFEVCENLFASGYLEESIIAAGFIYASKSILIAADMNLFERWIDSYIDNWAECDTFCNHSVAALVEKYPVLAEDLKRWAKSENMWLRRAAAVTLVLPARHGKFISEVFEIADILLADPEDLVRKGYGWMLKAASQSRQKEVFGYVMKNKKIMPRTALRYAIEKMPPDLKKKAMEK